jgi:antitoxin ParD1/3/4
MASPNWAEEAVMHVSLTSKLEAFVKAKVEAGLYNNASEVVREALRLMVEQEEVRRLKLDRLREEIAKGGADLAGGRYTTLASAEDITDFFSRL